MPQRTPKPWPQPRPAMAQKAFGAFANSSSHNFRQVDWYPTDYSPAKAEGWPQFGGDSSTHGWWPRGWKTAGLVAVREECIDQLEPAPRHPSVVPGVASVSLQNKVWAGVLPDGFGRLEHRGDTYASVAGRIGPGVLRVMPVLIDLSNSELLVPQVTPPDILVFGPVNFEPDLPGVFRTTPVV